MTIWSFIAANPDAVIGVATFLAGLLGVDRWRKKVRASTAEQVDRWASTAAGAVAMAIRSGVITDTDRAIELFVTRLKAIATAAGVKISTEHEARALAVAHETITAVGRAALEDDLHRLGAVAERMAERMAALPWPK